MKLCVDEEKCIGCGSCVSLTDSKIFDFNDEGKAQVIVDEIAKEDEENAKNALEYCPTGALSEKTEDEESGTSNKKSSTNDNK